MSKSKFRTRHVLAAAIGTVLLVGAVSQASAQSAQERAQARRDRHAQKSEETSTNRSEAKYPQATRTSPEAKASARVTPKLKKMMDLYEEDKGAEARAAADEIIANAAANAYDHAFAAQIGAQIAYEADDVAAAQAYLRKAMEFNGLDNNGHFDAMMMLAQLQLQEEQYADSLVTLDRFFSETQTQKPEHLVLKGNALYRLERYPEAATILKQAIDATPEPKADWLQLLMATYFETGQSAEAAALAEQIASKNPTDKRAQLNLAASYQQGDMLDKAIGVLEKLRAAGQMTEDKEYRQLYALYLNLDGKEREAANVINDGLQKGVLQGDFQTYLALAQAYYFSEQVAPAIEAYRKAAPLAPNGDTYLNLARVLWQEDRIPEAKEAAKQAIAKGLSKPEDARKILAL